MIKTLTKVAIAMGISVTGLSLPVHAADGDITIYTADKIITMEKPLPEAKAVAVSDGRIVSVGTLETLVDYVKAGAVIDTTFADKILMPGLIDPHVHPSLPAILTQYPYIAPDDWTLPTEEFPGETTPEGYVERLKELVAEYEKSGDTEIPFITWGYHPLWHGELYRDDLTDLFPDTPVILWHRSFHEHFLNDAAIELLGLTEEDAQIFPEESDWERGHWWENGLVGIFPKMPFILEESRYSQGMETFFEIVHQAGVTSVMDMGIGLFGDPVGETNLIRKVSEQTGAPVRVVLTPIITDFTARGKSPQEALAEIREWEKGNTDRVKFDNHFKLMMDGAIYSGLSQYGFPGYKDGHQGQWMNEPEDILEWARFFWNEAFQLHAHTNGDGSASLLIEIVRDLQEEKPRFDHRTTLEHFAYATRDQMRQMKALGMVVSANPYYQYILADVYADVWLGADVARFMVPLGSAADEGLIIGLHSDSPMAPLSPLTLAQNAMERVSINGNNNAGSEQLDIDQALRAITIDAAWFMRMEDEIGSIRAGKKADFVVLEQNPYEVQTADLSKIGIWGTVFEGQKYPIVKEASMKPNNDLVKVPNPSAVFCEESGGTYEIRDGADGGKTGICILPSGEEVDAWEFFRENAPTDG
ncbi:MULTISPECIES: amidohydrolase family protein [unclassified Ruegeria]|uniref:amidohydrolase family protein n=1 Tax=unclassified Ruegeria TaxID=2625375 RepID=UPI001C2BA058|nr:MULTISPECIES: amidohydrolase family protein [unclassified Ruegeria]